VFTTAASSCLPPSAKLPAAAAQPSPAQKAAPPACLTAEKSGRLTLGKRPLAGIVISSGPGGHFETYEGTQTAPSTSTRKRRGAKSQSLLRVNRLAGPKPPCPEPAASAETAMAAEDLQVDPAQSFCGDAAVLGDGGAQQELVLPLPDLTELTYEDVTSFASDLYAGPSGVDVTTTTTDFDPPNSHVPCMHELSLSWPNPIGGAEGSAAAAIRPPVMQPDPPEAVAQEEFLGGQGKYFVFARIIPSGSRRLLTRRLSSAMTARVIPYRTSSIGAPSRGQLIVLTVVWSGTCTRPTNKPCLPSSYKILDRWMAFGLGVR
jgi:hypothetical protein